MPKTVVAKSTERLNNTSADRKCDPAVAISEALVESICVIEYDRDLIRIAMRLTRDLYTVLADRDRQLVAARKELQRGSDAAEVLVAARGVGTVGVGRRRAA